MLIWLRRCTWKFPRF